MIRSFDFNIRKIILSILLFSGATFSLYSQGTSIGGVINEYMDVVAVGFPDNVTVRDAAIFNPGDTVLLIQMKGVVMYGYEDNQNGKWAYNIGSPGGYEFLIIQSVNYGTRTIIFTSNLSNSYDPAGLVQLIKVPYHNTATVTSELTCLPWDSVTTKTGGVLALIVGGTLTLDANINVNGMGFIGGATASGQAICVITDPTLYDKYAYPNTYTNSGFKGESLVTRAYLGPGNVPPIYPDYAKGKGSNFNGGGGGNGRLSGGGGGANIGSGGSGGKENGTICTVPYDGGSVGQQILNTVLETNMLFGGGGGSSTFTTGTASPGGRGGGIIIIVCDTLKSKGDFTISANGAGAASSNGNAGAGGGGGGGTIALYQQSFVLQPATSKLNLFSNGGKGGDSNNNNGEGGGGGGGLIYTNNIPTLDQVTMSFTGGVKGTRTGGSSAGWINSNPGESLTGFTPLLNGFLFNTIRSSVSHNSIDSVCSNMIPPKIIGTRPVGGSGSYTIEWQKSYESTFATPIILVNDTDPTNYTPTIADASTPTGTVFFRRIVRDAGPPAITDISKAVTIIVHPGISNNNIGSPDVFCETGNPLPLKQVIPDLVVPTRQFLFYTWQDSTNASLWNNITGFVNSPDSVYQPPILTATTSYRRIVISGSCIDTSKAVKMTILPLISGNTIYSPAEDSICYGMAFQVIRGTKKTGTVPLLTGGDNSFVYKWESSINFSPWATATGISDRDSLDPVELLVEGIPANYYQFRRIVYSGPDSACSDISDTVHLRDFAHITNYNLLIGANTPICSGSAPAIITGNPPNNGNGRYTWQDSTDIATQWKDIPGYVNTPNSEYQPPVLTATTSFRRITLSYGFGCNATSDPVKISVLPSVVNNNIYISLATLAPDTTICNGQTPRSLVGTPPSGGAGTGSYFYLWEQSTDGGTNWSPANGTNTLESYQSPSSLITTTLYRRTVISGSCSDISSSILTINVLPPISNNVITADQPAVCENTVPAPVTGSAVAGGSGSYIYLWEQSTDGGASWDMADGVNTLASYQPPALSTPVKYRRTVSSADCQSLISGEADISINPEPQSPVNAGEDASVYSLERTSVMDAVPPVVPGETGFWTVLEPGSASIDNNSDSKTKVRNLSTGTNLFVWSVTTGLCSIGDSVYVELLPDFIPQGFSPNGDSWNNTFIIKGLDLSEQIVELSILNGAGTVVFSTSNSGGQEWVDWDGKNNKGNELPEGTYYYLLKVTTQDKHIIRKKGFIELKRD